MTRPLLTKILLLGGMAALLASPAVAANIQLAGHPDHVDDEVSSGADVDVLR